ncbi:hypothetical protein J437_LFUL006946 [Ladona fulva]|uniref:Uncharacterized protein n=1 Tax=Ladona fulva TaxID=123851 RepID=A0A8K0P0L4_LADFU|nr:hypothetical protein J437_LFUL006946 [Ladona fulva]
MKEYSGRGCDHRDAGIPRVDRADCFFCLSLAGEVERLLREYRQNQELVRNIGAHYYQIIYPVQLRHHEKMGISTREVGQGKYEIEDILGIKNTSQ